ncbi:MAG: hypothetical protein VX574_04085 [Myxococcota bacterium]|nr:hypothetical protein [Myxococcota bacterium]
MAMLGLGALCCVSLLVFTSACSSPSPTENTAEQVHELRCRMSAQRYCAAQQGEEGDEYALNQCIGKRAWDCIMGQTPAEQRERYAPAPVAPPPGPVN